MPALRVRIIIIIIIITDPPGPDEPAIKMWDVPVKKPPPPSPAPTIDDYATTKAEFAARYDAAPPQVRTRIER